MSLLGTYRLVSAIENGSYTNATLTTALATARTRSEFQAALSDRALLTRLVNNTNSLTALLGATYTTPEQDLYNVSPELLCKVLPDSPSFVNSTLAYDDRLKRFYSVLGMQDAIHKSRNALSYLATPLYNGTRYVKQYFSQIRTDDTGPVLSMTYIGNTGSVIAVTATSVMIRRKGEDSFSRCNIPVAFVPSDVFYHPNTSIVVAVGSPAASSIWYSSDFGESWSLATNPGSATWNKVTWSGKWVAVGSGGNIISSTDAITWVSRTSGTAQALQDVYGDGTQYVAVGNAGAITRSADGDTWSLRTSGVAGNMLSVVGNSSGHFIACGVANTSLNATRSTDGGLTWTAQAIISGTTSFSNIVYNTQLATYYVGASTTGTVNLAAYSTNGTTWTNISFGSNSGSRVASYGSTVVIVPTLTTLGFGMMNTSSPNVRPLTNVDGSIIATSGNKAFLLDDAVYVNSGTTTLVCNNLPKV